MGLTPRLIVALSSLSQPVPGRALDNTPACSAVGDMVSVGYLSR